MTSHFCPEVEVERESFWLTIAQRDPPGQKCNFVFDPPLKKNVTWAYFSVSAIRACFKPCAAMTSPKVSSITSGANATEDFTPS
jgi:hypothetical protein